jgi:hypothetical protein
MAPPLSGSDEQRKFSEEFFFEKNAKVSQEDASRPWWIPNAGCRADAHDTLSTASPVSPVVSETTSEDSEPQEPGLIQDSALWTPFGLQKIPR